MMNGGTVGGVLPNGKGVGGKGRRETEGVNKSLKRLGNMEDPDKKQDRGQENIKKEETKKPRRVEDERE